MFNPVIQSRPFPSMALPYNPWKRHPLPASIADTQGNDGDTFVYGDPWLYSLVDSSGTKGTEHGRSSSTGLWWQPALDVANDADLDIGATGWYQDNNSLIDCGPMVVDDYVTLDLHGELLVSGLELSGRTDSDGLAWAGIEVFVTTDTNADNAFFDDSGFTYTSVGTWDLSAEFLAEAGAPTDVDTEIFFAAPVNATYVKIVCTAVHGVTPEPNWKFGRIACKISNSEQQRYLAARDGLVKSHMFAGNMEWVAFSDHPDADMANEDAVMAANYDTASAIFNLGTNGNLDIKFEGPALTISRIVFGGYGLGFSIPDDIAIYLREAGSDYVYYKKIKLEDSWKCQADLSEWTTGASDDTIQPHIIIPQTEYTGIRLVATKAGGGGQFWAWNSTTFYNEYLVGGTNPNQISDQAGAPVLSQLTNVAAAWSTADIGNIRPADSICTIADIGTTKYAYKQGGIYDGTFATDTNAAGAIGYASRLIDRSGNGHHLFTDTDALRPRLTGTSSPFAPLSTKAMLFDTEYLTALDQSVYNFAGGSATVFFVASQNSASTMQNYVLSKSYNGGFFVRLVDPTNATNGGKIVITFYKANSTAAHSAWRSESNTFDDDTLRVFCAKIDATNTASVSVRLWVNGSEVTMTRTFGPDGTYGDNAARTLHVGTWDQATTEYHNGSLDSIIWCSAAIADTTIEAVSASLMTVHGIS